MDGECWILSRPSQSCADVCGAPCQAIVDSAGYRVCAMTWAEGCGDAPCASWTMKVGWAVQGAPAALLDGALAQLARVDGVPRTRPSGAEAGLCDSVLPLSPDAVS